MKQSKLFEIIARLTIKQVELKKRISKIKGYYAAQVEQTEKIITERDQYAAAVEKLSQQYENPQGAAYRIHALKLEVDQLKERITELEGDK